MSGWAIPNQVRANNRLKRLAVYICAIQCGEPRHKARNRLGIPDRTARRYEAAVRC